jgi:hypothetical protein
MPCLHTFCIFQDGKLVCQNPDCGLMFTPPTIEKVKPRPFGFRSSSICHHPQNRRKWFSPQDPKDTRQVCTVPGCNKIV